MYQPFVPTVPDVEISRVGFIASILKSKGMLVVFPAISSDLKVAVYRPSDKERLSFHVFSSVDTNALSKPDVVSVPFTEIITGTDTNQLSKPVGVGTTGVTVGGTVSTLTSRDLVAEFPALS